MQLQENLSKAKAKLLVNYPAFGFIVAKMQFRADDTIQNFKSDGKKFLYNDTFLATCNQEALQFVLSHAALHTILRHTQRQHKRTPFLWQLATDYAISSMLKQSGLSVPDFAVYQERFDGMYAEEIYAILQEETNHQEEVDNTSTPQNLQEDHHPTHEQELQEYMEEKFIQKLLQENFETLPQAVQRFIKPKPKATICWKHLLRNAIITHAKEDYVLYPPAKKLLYQGVYLPSLTSNTLKLTIIIDTSGSIDDKLLELFFQEVGYILLSVSSYTIDLIVADDKIREHFTLQQGESLPTVVTGGCGTDFRVAFDYIHAQKLQPRLVLFFSDLEGIFPNKKVYYDVIWIAPKKKDVPFGKVIELTQTKEP
jgi:predicted metal-dependent peptidase